MPSVCIETCLFKFYGFFFEFKFLDYLSQRSLLATLNNHSSVVLMSPQMWGFPLNSTFEYSESLVPLRELVCSLLLQVVKVVDCTVCTCFLDHTKLSEYQEVLEQNHFPEQVFSLLSDEVYLAFSGAFLLDIRP